MDLSSIDDAAALPGSDDDTDKFSIVNDHTSEGVDTLAEEEKDLLAVRTKRTERHNNESAENFLLTREAVVVFRSGLYRKRGGPPEMERRQEWKIKCSFI